MIIVGFGLSGILVLITVFSVLYLLSLPQSLSEEDAIKLIRHYLRYQSSQQYTGLYKSGMLGVQAAKQYQEELNRIDQLKFESVKVGRFFPDHFLSEWSPTFYAKAVIRDHNGQVQTRYFNLGTGALVIGESSKFVWRFVF